MTDGPPLIDKFRDDILAVICKYHAAMSLSRAEVVGMLEYIKFDILNEDHEDET